MAEEKMLERISPSPIGDLSLYSTIHQNRNSIFRLINHKDKVKFIKGFVSLINEINPLCLNDENQTPFMYACKMKKWNNAITILDHFGSLCLSNILDINGFDVLYYSCGNNELLSKLLTYKTIFLDFDKKYNDETLLILLLKCGANINYSHIIQSMSVDSLNYCNKAGENALILSCKGLKFQCALDIINRGVKLTYHDNTGNSAISYLLCNLNETDDSELVHVCLRLITKANRRNSGSKVFNSRLKTFDEDQFLNVTEVSKSKGTYGNIKWAIDSKTGEHKMLKHYFNYNNLQLIKEDIVKELIFLRKMNELNDYTVKVDGIYINDEGHFHLVFEPLAMTLYRFFKIVSKNPELLKSKVVSIFEQLKEYVRKMHHLGIIHNDLKLENIMISYDGKIKILDFGISEFIGYSPHKYVASHYITTSYIGAPDFGRDINFTIYDEKCENIVGRFRAKSNRKSYSSDVYSLGVSIIQGILRESIKFISIGNKLYYVSKSDKELTESSVNDKSQSLNENIKPVSDDKVRILSSYSFYPELMKMIDVDSNIRISRNKLNDNVHIHDYVKSDIKLLNNIVHYKAKEIRNQLNEMVYAEEIFNSYKDSKIKMNGRDNTIHYKEIFNDIISILPSSVSIDAILNAIYHTMNYKDHEDLTIVFISYLYIFSFIFEWYTYDIETIANKLSIDKQILICKINNTIISLLNTVKYIPFVVLIEKIVILMQMNSCYFIEDIHKIENTIYEHFFSYFTEISNNEEFDVWEFIQCSAYSKSLLPFEITITSDSIPQIFSKL